jgi:site-specific DNA-methyltransferase (adenine-specific)
MPDNVTLLQGDCRDVLREMARQNGTGPRFTALVTDPPAGISFMGKEWDNPNGVSRTGSGIGQEGKDADYDRYGKGAMPYGYSGSNAGRNITDREAFIATMTEIAALALDLCLPGAHALVWALPRTSHWTATAWENGGWEVRDRIRYASSKDAKVAAFLASLTDEQRKALEVISDDSGVSHCFGSGFPKSLDVSKALDKAAGMEREVVAGRGWHHSTGRGNGMAGNADESWPKPYEAGDAARGEPITAPATALAREWAGYGSALKPAIEDWWLLRKPLDGTIAGNAAKHGCGALNVDGCRVELDDAAKSMLGKAKQRTNKPSGKGLHHDPDSTVERERLQAEIDTFKASGRFPAHLITDGSEEVTACFPSPHGAGFKRNPYADGKGETGIYGAYGGEGVGGARIGDTGSAARFFAVCPPDADAPRLAYIPKASRREREAGCDGLEFHGRNEVYGDGFNTATKCDPSMHTTESVEARPQVRNGHPTVKPLALCRYLLTLLRQPTVNLVLDPFMGSGSTGVACVQLGIPFVGIERDPEYFEIARRRIAHAQEQMAAQPLAQLELL